MKTINDILNFFEEFAPCATQMSFDNAGLIVGDKCTAVSRVLVALDITEDVVNEAESLGCELIISHHPVIFAPIKRLSPSSVPYLLAQKGISAVCMHTNLDLGEKFGVNICLADALGVKNPVLSGLGECMFTGELESETDIHDFAKLAKKNADMIVANNLKVAGAGFGTDTNVVTLITADDCTELEIMDKSCVAARIMDRLLQM